MKQNYEKEEGRDSKVCPFCGSDISKDAIKCKECHQWLNTKIAQKRELQIKEKKGDDAKPDEEKSGETKKNIFMNCPYCAEEIPGYAYICKHCHENIHNRKTRRLVYKLHETENLDVYYQPSWRLIVLSVITLNLYQIYWIFRNWKFMKVHMKLKVHPFLKVLYLLIPVVGLISVYHQFRSINILAERNEVPKTFSPILVIFVWSMFLIEGGVFLISGLLGSTVSFLLILVTSLMGLLSVFPLTLVQETMNAILLDEKPGLKMRKGLSIYEVFLIIISLSGVLVLIIEKLNRP